MLTLRTVSENSDLPSHLFSLVVTLPVCINNISIKGETAENNKRHLFALLWWLAGTSFSDFSIKFI